MQHDHMHMWMPFPRILAALDFVRADCAFELGPRHAGPLAAQVGAPRLLHVAEGVRQVPKAFGKVRVVFHGQRDQGGTKTTVSRRNYLQTCQVRLHPFGAVRSKRTEQMLVAELSRVKSHLLYRVVMPEQQVVTTRAHVRC